MIVICAFSDMPSLNLYYVTLLRIDRHGDISNNARLKDREKMERKFQETVPAAVNISEFKRFRS